MNHRDTESVADSELHHKDTKRKSSVEESNTKGTKNTKGSEDVRCQMRDVKCQKYSLSLDGCCSYSS